MTGSILCGVDGSRNAQAALRVAARLAERIGAPLIGVHVVQAPMGSPGLAPASGMSLMTLPAEPEIRAGEELLEEILLDEGLDDADRRVAYGFPAERLADLADEEQAELVVVGSRGRGTFRTAFLGSVSSDLIGIARCPVLVVPPGAVEALDNGRSN